MSPRLLEECSAVITDGLVLLFKGDTPDAIVAPTFKGGNKNKTVVENYRPVSQIINHLDKYNM